MLIIRRREGESLLIGEDVEIQVVELSANRVKLGITAPSGILILRKEIQLAAEQNRAASKHIDPLAVGRVLTNYCHAKQLALLPRFRVNASLGPGNGGEVGETVAE